jgi:hypothetical protein
MNSKQLDVKRFPLTRRPDPRSDREITVGVWILTLLLYLGLALTLYIIWLRTNPS